MQSPRRKDILTQKTTEFELMLFARTFPLSNDASEYSNYFLAGPFDQPIALLESKQHIEPQSSHSIVALNVFA